MTEEQLKAFVTLMMCSDPWPVDEPGNQAIIEKFADEESQKHNFRDWIEAYHAL
jgi:hypothetical protein